MSNVPLVDYGIYGYARPTDWVQLHTEEAYPKSNFSDGF